MRYQNFREQLKNFTVFSLADIRKIEPEFYRSRLNEWQKKGYIKKLRRDYYIFSDTALNEGVLFLIANHLYTPSYVSFETALSHYGLIPEGVYSITSISSKKTARFQTPIAQFNYHRLMPNLFFGYRLERQGDQSYKIAEIEKAALDYLYLHPDIVREADFYEWRFNSYDFLSMADIQKLRKYANAFHNKAFSVRVEKFITLIKQVK